jgi:hypothetical protein
MAPRSQHFTAGLSNPKHGHFSCGNPQIAMISRTHLSAELSKIVKSSFRHCPLEVVLFDASYLLDVRLYKCATDTRRII